MNNRECDSCIKRKTIYCPNSEKCYCTEDKPFYMSKIDALEEIESCDYIINKGDRDRLALSKGNRKLRNRINKAIKYIKENEEEYGSLEDNEKIIIEILEGAE